MSIAMVLKVFSDCCICFALLGSGPVQFRIPLLIHALICGICAGIATFFESKGWIVLRRLCALLPLLCLLLTDNQSQMLVLAVPILYTAQLILRNKLELDYSGYRRFFLQSLGLLGAAYLLVNAWIFLAQITSETPPVLDGSVILRYGLVHLVCGIVLQRQLRLGVTYQSKSNRRQLSALLIVAGVIILAFITAEPLLRQQAAVLIKSSLSVLVMPIMLLLELFAWLINRWDQETQADPESGHATVDSPNEGVSGSVSGNIGQTTPHTPETNLDPNIVWLVLILILLLIAIIILFRSFQKRSATGDPGEIVGHVVAAPKKKRLSVLSNRHKVRQFYRDFLRLENGWGLKLKRSDTSADVLRRIHPETDPENAGKLRQLYLIARYDDRQTISRSHVNAAKQACKSAHRAKK